MIRIHCTEPDDERWRKWKVQCQRAQAKLNAQVASGQPVNFAERVYKGSTYRVRDWFFFALDLPPFFGKCVYCEKKIWSSQHGDVEHFRPKDAVTDTNNETVHVVMNNALVPHPGYYWLAYNWHNLVPSCSLCNTFNHRSEDGRMIGKGTRFPVFGQHATAMGQEAAEQPLLLLPTEDEISNHIEVTQTGILKEKSPRGRETIKLLGLNDRGLPDERRQVYQNTKLRLAASIYSVALGDSSGMLECMKAETKRIDAGAVEFSAMARLAMRDYWVTVDREKGELGST